MNRIRSFVTLVTTLAVVMASLVLVVSLPRESKAFTPHLPIYINGNGAFTPANGVTGGSGIPSDPYIIEGWDVNHSKYTGCGIQITNTDAHFIIRNLLVHDGVWGPFGGEYDAICIGPSVANGRVESVETRLNWNAVDVFRSRDINVSVNYANGDWGSAVSIRSSANISVMRNMAAIISHSNESAGAYVVTSSNVTIIDNQFVDAYNGVSLTDSTNITVIGNRLEGNIGWGAFVRNSTGVRVHHNSFIDNSALYGGIQAHDDRGSENSWDDGCSGGGNYWSDYNGSDRRDCSTGAVGLDGFGDAPRVIDADSQDNYPLVSSSMADNIRPYWHNSTFMDVTASARMNYPGIRNVALWYRYSTDNATWSNWTFFQSLNLPPWSWSFYFPDGEGYYEYYTIATTFLGRIETPPASAQAIAGHDTTPPASSAIPISPYRHTAPPLIVDATASDNLSGVDNVALLYSFSSDNNATWGAWTSFGTDDSPPWSWSFPFPDGQGHYRFNTIAGDVAGNAEQSKSTVEAVAGYFVPTEPPITSLLIGKPNYTSTAMFIKPSTPLDFFVLDHSGLGIRNTTYTVDGGAPVNYTAIGTLFLAGEGMHTIEWRSLDWAENLEEVSSKMLTVDNTPPATTITQSEVQATIETFFNLTAADSGCGVNITRYRIDGGDWTDYSGGFTLTEGEHNITYYSNDRLNNTEREKWLVVTVKGTTTPPEIAVNFKPIVALVFTIILLAAGIRSSKRRPWKGEKNKMALVKAFAITSLPFVIAEAVTGVVSFLTGQLSIPPLLGIGTAVDLTILLAGLAVAVLRATRAGPSKADLTNEPEGP